MSERYTHQLLKVVVAQICQTIGWHSIQSTPMELMVDILDQYLRDITKVTHRYAELYNRTDPNLDDVALACREMGMNLGEMQEYLEYVDPIERPFEVPKYPLPKDSHLNFMKPGSKEVLTRPVHIPEHMPPMLVDSEEEQEEEERRRQMMMMGVEADAEEVDQEDVKPEIGEVVEKMEEVGAEEVAVMDASQSEEVVTFKRPLDGPVGEGGLVGDVKKSKTLSDERRPTREISSVIMTTSGFISPAREGRLPDSKPPEIPEEKPKPPPPPPPAPVSTALPVAKFDDKFGKKAKKKPTEKEKKDKKEKKVDKKKENADKEKEAKSRPATPTIPHKDQLEAPLPILVSGSSFTDDIKPFAAPVELPLKPPTPVPDVKPPLPIEPEKPLVPPPVVPVVPLPKPKKEKAPRKKKEPKQKPPLPPMIPNPAMDVGAIFPPAQTIPPLPLPSPLVNQITPPKPPKPKRTKMTKKQMERRQYMEHLQQFQDGPLNAQNILDMLTPPGKKPLPGLFQSPLFPSQKQLQPALPPHQQPKFPDNVAQSQLDMLQKLHPSLEITPAPGPSSIPPMHASPEKHKLNIFKKVAKKEAPPQAPPQGPIIVIDDDKSPPHQPLFPMTPMGKKRAPKTSGSGFSFQDTLSSPDMGFNMSMTPSDHSGGLGHSGSFREFSPPKTPSNLPKTPDIKMPSSSSSSASWMSDSGKFGAGPGPLFGDFPNFGLPPSAVKEAKKKKPRQPKQPKETAASKKAKTTGLLEELKLLQQFQQFPPAPPGPGPIDKKPPLQDVYNKLAMPPMPPAFLASQLRNPGMFGMFPLSSGPGLIPENPLFNPFNPSQSFLPPGYGMPTLPPRFDISKLLQNPRPSKAPSMDFDNLDPETKLAHTPLDLQKSTCNVAPLVPPSLQIDPVPTHPSTGSSSSRKKHQISPIVKEHFLQEQSLNLSIKSNVIHQNPTVPSSIIPQPPAAHQQPKCPLEPLTYSTKDLPKSSTTPTTMIPSHHPPPQTQTPAPMTPQPQILPTLAAASPTVPPITPGETIVIETDSDTNSQSTVTMAAMGISPPQSSGGSSTKPLAAGTNRDKSEKRSKNKEHKKDRKLKEGKEGKVKKKKDKKDKNKSKDRDRERPRSSHSMNQELSDGAMEQSFSATAATGAAPPEDAATLQEQIRRKEKKEKKKEKLKKEKRKEKERAAAAALESSFTEQRSSFNLSGSANSDLFTSGPSASSISVLEHRNSPDAASGSVPKLMLKLGSTNTPSPRSGTPDNHPQPHAESASKPPEVKREASPELARISALFTRPPKLKTPGSKGKSKDADESAKAPKLSVDHSSKAAGKLDFSGTDQPTKPRPRGIQALPDSIDLFSVTPTPAHLPQPKPSLAVASGSSSSDHHPTPHSSKKPPKEPKSSKSVSASASLGVTIPAPLNTPINMQDADGNVVWICPACGRVDDGTPMIGCDGCDAWYHWVCVGIQVPPDSNEDWYCRVCIGKKQESHGDEKQKKRKKKDKKNPKD